MSSNRYVYLRLKEIKRIMLEAVSIVIYIYKIYRSDKNGTKLIPFLLFILAFILTYQLWHSICRSARP
ncbi:Uncharacterised protein [Serratia quinivorans]|nr:Uncharacterised protein [Serratia quinivorans]